MHPFPLLGYWFTQAYTMFYLIFVSLVTNGVPSTEKALNTYLIKECGYFLDKIIIIETLNWKKNHSQNHHLRDLKTFRVCTLCSWFFKQSKSTLVSYYTWLINWFISFFSSCRETLFQKISLVYSPLTPDLLLLLPRLAVQTQSSVPLTWIDALHAFRFQDWEHFPCGSWDLFFPPGSYPCCCPVIMTLLGSRNILRIIKETFRVPSKNGSKYKMNWIKRDTCGHLGFPGGSDSKESACNAGDSGSTPGPGRSLEKGMATHSSILAWKIP